MRFVLIFFWIPCALSVTCPLPAFGDQPAAVPVAWKQAFAPVSASQPFSLVLLLITNDDAFAPPRRVPRGDADPESRAWCQSLFERAYLGAITTRPDLRKRCFPQYLPVGTPETLTGGEPRNQPSRAIVAICDGNYRLLSVAVGIPESEEMLTMIEDAQQIHSMLKLNGQDKAKTASEVAERSMLRITRLWRDALREMLATMDVGNNDPGNDNFVTTDQLTSTLGRIAQSYQEVYLSDVRLRFGLSEATDRTRLVVLEQHLETRQPWCESMMPFIAGTDFIDTWRPLTEAVWGVSPVSQDGEADELLAWWDNKVKNDPIVLAIQPPLLQRQRVWPPVVVGGVADQRGLGWQDLQKLLLEMPYRNIDTEQLAALVRQRELQPLDIQQPSRARYLFFEPGKASPFVIREGDVPGKPIGRIKRAITRER